MNRYYYSVNEYLQQLYGEKIYKLALKGGQTCPNRDGTRGEGGCIFCGEGSGSFAAETIDEAISRLSNKHTGDHYIAYFQSYTCTYKMSDDLIRRLYDAAADARIRIISLATRPDCLQPEVLELLKDLQRHKPVWVELGLQTIHEKTARLINRGYSLSEFEKGLRDLNSIGIDVIVHLILGLPGESREDILASIHYLNHCQIRGIKLQLLHVLKGTVLGSMFLAENSRFLAENSRFPADSKMFPADNDLNENNYPFTLDEYTDLICECIAELRPDIVIHRITGDAPKKDLLAPLWSADKKKVLNFLNQKLKESALERNTTREKSQL